MLEVSLVKDSHCQFSSTKKSFKIYFITLKSLPPFSRQPRLYESEKRNIRSIPISSVEKAFPCIKTEEENFIMRYQQREYLLFPFKLQRGLVSTYL